MSISNIRMIREPEREQITGISRTNFWRMEKAGKAPKRVRLGKNTVAWLESEIHAWLKERAAAREVQ